MSDKRNDNAPDKLTGRGVGPQGIDKAPGEETSHSVEPVVQQTQKGKNKVDGDPSKESDQPLEQS
jgi:hypothetical protein